MDATLPVICSDHCGNNCNSVLEQTVISSSLHKQIGLVFVDTDKEEEEEERCENKEGQREKNSLVYSVSVGHWFGALMCLINGFRSGLLNCENGYRKLFSFIHVPFSNWYVFFVELLTWKIFITLESCLSYKIRH